MKTTVKIEGFAERLDQAIEASGMSRNQIANLMGMERKVLLPTSTGCQMGSGVLVKFCGITGVSADWLLGLKKEMRL